MISRIFVQQVSNGSKLLDFLKIWIKEFFPFVKGGDVYVLFSETIKFLPDRDVNCPHVKRVFPQNCTKYDALWANVGSTVFVDLRFATF